jgi:H+/Cl- antiporter ClcA
MGEFNKNTSYFFIISACDYYISLYIIQTARRGYTLNFGNKNTPVPKIDISFAKLLMGILVGLAAGLVSVFYRASLDYAEKGTRLAISYVSNHPFRIVMWFIFLIIISILVSKLISYEPLISGSGIPQVSGEVQGKLNQNWFGILICKITGGILCILGGLSLGREGPSVQLGAMAGKGISKWLKQDIGDERLLLTCGAGAGLAAAFNAPLAGILFAFEEVHKKFSSAVLFTAISASFTADIISKQVFGTSPIFHFGTKNPLPFENYWIVIILGIILGILGGIYNITTLKTQDLYGRLRNIRPCFKMVIPFVIAGILGFTMPQVLGGGHTMIKMLEQGSLTLYSILILLLCKFFFSMISFGSGAPGGIFFPLLVLGSYIGGAFGLFCVSFFGLDTALISNLILLSMAGYFTAIVRAPFTGIFLICEMTGFYYDMLPLMIVSLTAYTVAAMLKCVPIYDSLLERILKKHGISEKQIANAK